MPRTAQLSPRPNDPTLSPDAQELARLWRACPIQDGMPQPNDAFMNFVDGLLNRGVIDGAIDEVMPTLPPEWKVMLFHVCQDAAMRFAFIEVDRDEGHTAQLLAMGFTGPPGLVDTWLSEPARHEALTQLVDTWVERCLIHDGLPTDPTCDVRIFPLAFHPEAIAGATPQQIHNFIVAMLNGEEDINDPLLQAQFDLSDHPINPPGHIEPRLLLCLITATDPQANPANWRKHTGVFDALLEQGDEAYGREGLAHDWWWGHADRCQPPLASTLLPPHTVPHVLDLALHSKLVFTWSADLEDRGAGLSQPFRAQEITALLTAVDVLEDPEEPNVQVVQAESSLGPLLPIRISLPWALVSGTNTLTDLMQELVGAVPDGDSPPTQEDLASEPQDWSEEPPPLRPAPKRVLH